MKKFITLLLAVAISATVIGQVIPERLENIKSFNKHEKIDAFLSIDKMFPNFQSRTKSLKFQRSTNSTKQKLDSIINKNYNYHTKQCVATEKDVNIYDADGNNTLNYTYLWDTISNMWLAKLKYINTFDSRGNCIKSIIYIWDNISSQWVNYSKGNCTYNSKGYQTMHNRFDWDVNSKKWEGEYQINYTYNSNDKIMLRTHFGYDKSTNKLIINSKYNWTYDANDNLTLEIFYIWNKSTNKWDNNFKWEYINNANGLVEIFTNYTWDNKSNKWLAFSKSEYTYDTTGGIIKISNKWDFKTSNWVKQGKGEYTNDTNKKTTITYLWDKVNKQWKYNNKRERNYDYNNNLISEIHSRRKNNQWFNSSEYKYNYDYAYNYSALLMPAPNFMYFHSFLEVKNKPINLIFYQFIDSTWTEVGKEIYYYSTTNVGIPDNLKMGLSIFPNPAKDFITFDIDNISSSSTIEIFDIQGRKVLSQLIPKNKQISVKHLTKGLYLYKIRSNDNKFYTGKIIVE